MHQDKPNVVLILVDDMGFADLGFMGSEIRSQNLDKLAADGIVLTSMYNCGRCCPTRASLLTGLYPHKAGIGWMSPDFGIPAYQGSLRNDSATIAEVLRLNGYRTLMSGKWHVGGDFEARETDDWRPGEPGYPTPRQRGFDRFFGLLDGATNFFFPHYVMEDDQRVEITADDFYLTDAISDKAVGMIEDAAKDDQPFFLYLAYNAPHWPLHAPEEDIARYEGVYRKGWDEVRTARHEEMIGRGALENPWPISPRDKDAPEWSGVAHKDWEDSRMAVYAAMVDRMDQGVGQVVAALKRLGMFENTLIMFLSDNGGCAELLAEDGLCKPFPSELSNGQHVKMGNRPSLRPGSPTTFMSYDLPWANVSNAPFRLYKHWVHEGGISTPMVLHWPDRITDRGFAHAAYHVVDVVPTILDVTGAQYPREMGGNSIQALDGESFAAVFADRAKNRASPIFWEHEGNAAIRNGDWKLVRRFGQDWELYNMVEDRTELNDLSRKATDRRDDMIRDYNHWAETVGVEDWAEMKKRLARILGSSRAGDFGDPSAF